MKIAGKNVNLVALFFAIRRVLKGVDEALQDRVITWRESVELIIFPLFTELGIDIDKRGFRFSKPKNGNGNTNNTGNGN